MSSYWVSNFSHNRLRRTMRVWTACRVIFVAPSFFKFDTDRDMRECRFRASVRFVGPNSWFTHFFSFSNNALNMTYPIPPLPADNPARKIRKCIRMHYESEWGARMAQGWRNTKIVWMFILVFLKIETQFIFKSHTHKFGKIYEINCTKDKYNRLMRTTR